MCLSVQRPWVTLFASEGKKRKTTLFENLAKGHICPSMKKGEEIRRMCRDDGRSWCESGCVNLCDLDVEGSVRPTLTVQHGILSTLLHRTLWRCARYALHSTARIIVTFSVLVTLHLIFHWIMVCNFLDRNPKFGFTCSGANSRGWVVVCVDKLVGTRNLIYQGAAEP